ncbi:TerB family tellurite resistance protein [Microvirga antarctica]|uniref:tellurite resistance TerB family protein n=1 Tax=Microvirga antarctica TaxID=2819233 RepID=UPI001B309328|nr:TerB family tellurite resistance protein [Microvirga antarctica]
MSVISSLRDALRLAAPPSAAHEEQLTAAALLILVAHADGRVLPVETDGLLVLLGSRFALAPEAARGLLDDAARLEAGIDPSTTLIERIIHDVPFEDRGPLLGLAYRVAAMDGTIHEFEDDLIWRTGRLLGFSDRDLAELKAEVLKDLQALPAHG